MTKTAWSRHTMEFKQEAVCLVKGGQSMAAAARTLDVVDQTLFSWVKAHRQGKLEGADSKRKVSAEQMEIARLRAELARTKMERDILGKGDPQRHRWVWPISVQCRVLEISGAGHHEHFVPRASAEQRRHLSNDALLVYIKAIHAVTRGGCGWPR